MLVPIYLCIVLALSVANKVECLWRHDYEFRETMSCPTGLSSLPGGKGQNSDKSPAKMFCMRKTGKVPRDVNSGYLPCRDTLTRPHLPVKDHASTSLLPPPSFPNGIQEQFQQTLEFLKFRLLMQKCRSPRVSILDNPWCGLILCSLRGRPDNHMSAFYKLLLLHFPLLSTAI